MISLVILDLDGPILDGKLRHYSCYSDILQEHGFDPMTIERYWELKRNRCDLHEQLMVSGAEGIHDQFLQLWLERIENRKYLKMDRQQPGALRRIRIWNSQGFRLVLATMRNNPENLHWQLRSFGILDLFDQILVVGGGHDGYKKAEAVQKQIEFNPSSTVWIGDTEADVFAARQIGVRIIAVTCGLRVKSYLTSLEPDCLMPDLQSVCLEEIAPC